MATTNLGRVGLVPKGEYSATTAYKKLDIVSSSGNTYVAVVNSTGASLTDTTKWKIIVNNTMLLTPKADKVAGATNGNLAGQNSSGNLTDSGKKASDFATAAQGTKADNAATELTAARGTYSALGNRIDAQQESIEELKDQSRVHKYGVLWDGVNATCTRLYDAVGLTANAHLGSYNANLVNDFDNIYPWSGRKLCNIDIAEYKRLYEAGGDIEDAITAWEEDPDFSYTGENGAVMVYTPGFWMHTEKTDEGTIVAVADKEIRGWVKVPRYIGGRYFASDDGNGGVTSVAGAVPQAHIAMSTIHTKAKTNNMTLDDIWTWTYDTVLQAVEFATLNTQSAVGSGADSVYRYDGNNIDYPQVAEAGANRVIAPAALADAAVVGAVLDIGTSGNSAQVARRIVTSVETYAENTGYKIVNFAGDPVDILTTHCLSIHGVGNAIDSDIGSKSGYIGANDKVNAYYRGRVAHANVWRYVLGAYREKDTGHIWIAHDREEADGSDTLDVTKHIDTGFTLPYQADGIAQKEGYVKELYLHEKFPLFPFVKDVGGNSANPVGDYCYHPAKTAANTILIAGGNAYIGAYCGRLYGYWGYTAGNSPWNFAALPFLK